MSRETLIHYIHRKTQTMSKTHKSTSRHPLSTFSCFKTQNGIPKFFAIHTLFSIHGIDVSNRCLVIIIDTYWCQKH